ncbi:MAG: B12-binding domain-containing radical SAM protein, partial [Lentisphaerae bacterium]|nr:B12-binding domain-containing radical SAM protein [Lentisphaerota bacterium]
MRNSRKTITFLEVNSSYSHTMLSYGYLRAYTEKMLSGWNWNHIETTINEDGDTALMKILSAKPAAVCATLYLFNHEYTVRILKKLKRLLPDCRIFLGGPEFLGDNEDFLLRNPEVNAVMRGDESSFHILLANLTKKDKWEKIPGLCFIHSGKYFDAGFAKFADGLDESPSPYEKGYYTSGRPFYQIETSRGCGGKCSFCTSALSDDVTCFSISRIRSELEILSKAGICEIRIVDRTFNENKKRALALLKIFRQYPETRFHLEINPALVDDELLEELSLFKAKRLHIEAGIQTLCAKSIKAVKRSGSPEKTLSGLKKLCRLGNAELHADLIAGLPDQKLRDVLDDVKKLISINPHEIQLENLKILPGTSISVNPPAGTVWNPLPPYEVLKTKTMTALQIQTAKHLSKMLDSYLNFPRLKNLIRFAFLRDRSFIEKFLHHLETNSDPMQKYHLDKRLLLLKDYADKNDKLLAEFAVFFWLSGGFPPDKCITGILPVTTRKIKNIREDESPNWRNIYTSNENIPPSKAIEIEFDFNAGDLWL